MDFEKGIGRLEEIVSALENGGTKLEDSIEIYKEGIELAAALSKKLADAEEKLKEIKMPAEL